MELLIGSLFAAAVIDVLSHFVRVRPRWEVGAVVAISASAAAVYRPSTGGRIVLLFGGIVGGAFLFRGLTRAVRAAADWLELDVLRRASRWR